MMEGGFEQCNDWKLSKEIVFLLCVCVKDVD
jgi:hypothetical protein